jgi:hypothetical protein
LFFVVKLSKGIDNSREASFLSENFVIFVPQLGCSSGANLDKEARL